jgi:hypothetical protein
MTDAPARSDECEVLTFTRRIRPGTVDKYYWSVTFECTREEVLSVQVTGVGDGVEDKRRIVDVLRNLADDIDYELEHGAQT